MTMRTMLRLLAALARFIRWTAVGAVVVLSVSLILISLIFWARSNSRWDILSGTRITGDDSDSLVYIVQLQSADGGVKVFTVVEHWRVGVSPLDERYWNHGWVIDRWHGPLVKNRRALASINVTITPPPGALPARPGAQDYAWHGFEYHSDFRKAGPNDRHIRQVWFPHWPLAIIGAIPLIALFLRGSRRRSRIRHGLCGECGYDLRASHERCPECGTAFTSDRFHTGNPAAATATTAVTVDKA